jgi:hypothetical protein
MIEFRCASVPNVDWSSLSCFHPHSAICRQTSQPGFPISTGFQISTSNEAIFIAYSSCRLEYMPSGPAVKAQTLSPGWPHPQKNHAPRKGVVYRNANSKAKANVCPLDGWSGQDDGRSLTCLVASWRAHGRYRWSVPVRVILSASQKALSEMIFPSSLTLYTNVPSTMAFIPLGRVVVIVPVFATSMPAA